MKIDGTPDIRDAIWHLKNDAQYKIGEEGLSSLVWLDGNPTNITNIQIETKLAIMKYLEPMELDELDQICTHNNDIISYFYFYDKLN